MSHSTVLLAGGNSTRMSRDKAALIIDGKPLWRHQLATLRATQPAEVFISGKGDGPYANAGVTVVPDETPGLGPLGGLTTALRHCSGDWLLVLAVDMPAMTPAFLRTLLDESQRTAAGIVPSAAADGRRRARRSPSGCDDEQARLEPLAAVYPRAALAVADECLRAGERKLETFVRALEARSLVTIRPVESELSSLFMNWNAPEDIA